MDSPNLAIIANAIKLLQQIEAHDAELDAPGGDVDRARAPTGDDYNEIHDLARAALAVLLQAPPPKA